MNRVVSYSMGLVLALILTITAFSLTFMHSYSLSGAMPSAILVPVILGLAMVQLTVQLAFFLHLGQGKDSQWNAAMFCFTFTAVLAVVLASVWIMDHLNYNMTPTETTQYITDQSTF